jgi:hypothetical protein
MPQMSRPVHVHVFEIFTSDETRSSAPSAARRFQIFPNQIPTSCRESSFYFMPLDYLARRSILIDDCGSINHREEGGARDD